MRDGAEPVRDHARQDRASSAPPNVLAALANAILQSLDGVGAVDGTVSHEA